MKCSTRTGLLATACSLLFALPASATLIAADGFNYTALSQLHNQSGGQGWDSSWDVPDAGNQDSAVIVNGGLSYTGGTGLTQISISGGSTALRLGDDAGTGTQLLGTRDLTATSADTVYFSYLMRFPTSVLSGTRWAGSRLGVDSDSESSGEVNFDGIDRPGSRLLNTSGTAGGASGSDTSSDAFVADTTYFIVAKMYASGDNGANFDRMQLFVNPTSNVTEGGIFASLDEVSNNTGTNTLGAFTFLGNFLNVENSFALVDELQVTTSWAEAVSPISPIPEPSASAAVLGLLGGLLAFRRRRA